MPDPKKSLSDEEALALTELIQFKVGRFVASSPKLSAPDLVQEAFVRLLKSLHKFDRSRGTLRTFVARITENVLIDQGRRVSAHKRNPDRVDDQQGRKPRPKDWSTPFHKSGQPDQASEERLRDLKLDLLEAIEQLPPDLQRLAEDLKQWSVPEIAERESVHPGTIYRRKKRIRDRWDDGTLRDYLEP